MEHRNVNHNNSSNQPSGRADSVLITGGSGMTGRYLTSLLLEKGYKVSHLSRNENSFGRVRVYRWDPAKGILDKEILSDTDHIIHLAGTGIGDQRWTAKRRSEILLSRTASAQLLSEKIRAGNIKIKSFISSSAVGYYGAITSDKIFTETDPPSADFLGRVCSEWEKSADHFTETGARVVKLRTGVVLDNSGGALISLLKPLRYGLVPVAGSGKQYMPWIHIFDLCNLYIRAVEDNSMAGSYNSVAPEYVTNYQFMNCLSDVTGKKGVRFNVPAPLMRIALGSMSDIILKGSRVSPAKIISAGYTFKFEKLKDAIEECMESTAEK